ncbi:unnamed protein product [Orchesella dallaii]|uniref:G-protein coupled receptors family 3 profile domain-containing protein n=1 Tax=Orchesella dallaii TaxID=48710 RepID=A0ABP1PKD6_9HEXA
MRVHLSISFCVLINVSYTVANLCVLCQSLSEHVPNEFHSCLFGKYEIKHCDQNIDKEIAAHKVIGVKRIVRVNYGDGPKMWELGVSVVQDYYESHHAHASTSSSNAHEHHRNKNESHVSRVNLAVIRFSKYPSSLLMMNPCKHVLGTSNAVGKRSHNLQQRTTQSLYFAIEDKACHGGAGKRKKCMGVFGNSSSVSPYVCCVPGSHGTSSRCEEEDESDRVSSVLRPVVLSIQCICMGLSVLLSILIFWIRKTKVIQVSIWPLTISIIIGSMLMYATIAIRAAYKFDDNAEMVLNEHDPNAWACVAEPWARELGFVLVYGGIVLKIYRSLVEFRTRKAHRWVVREKDILRYLGTTVSVVLFYLLAWTCTVQVFGRDMPWWEETHRTQHLVCPAVTPWHRVTEIGELLYVSVGLNMAWHLRTSPVSPFMERQMYTAALVIEAGCSIILMIIRESKILFFNDTPQHDDENAHDDNDEFLLLLYFVRCQVVTTTVLAIVLGPKLYYVYVDSRSRKRAQLRRGDTLTGTQTGSVGGGAGTGSLSNLTNLKLNTTGMVGGVDHTTLIDLDFAEVSLAEMDPQDIKMELKRVYTQLELLRNKTMRKDNPHISKRRGGRKPTHRRFSLQKKGSRDKTAAAAAAMRSRLQAQASEAYGNNRYSSRYNDDIEDSVCSIEGPSTYSEVGGYR